MQTLSRSTYQKNTDFSHDSTIVQPLGNNANIASRTETKHTISTTQQKKQRRFMLLDAARKILRNHNVMNSKGNKSHRTRTCLAVRYDKTQDIGITLNDNPNKSTAGLQNLVTCDSICSCPVCAHKKMLGYAVDIRKALKYAENNGLVPLMLTLTAEHHKGTNLEEFVKRFKSAWRYFSGGRQWQALRETYQIKHSITAREVTREGYVNDSGQRVDNGWHYHMHILLFLDGSQVMENDDFESIRAALTERWLTALDKKELRGSPENACDVRAGANVGDHYLTKLGLTETAKGKLDYELTGNENKGITIWDVLYDAAFGDIRSEYLYLEYVQVMSGENWITFSHDLKDLTADIELDVTEETVSEKLTLFYWISQENWSVVVRNNRVGEMLMIAAKYRSIDRIQKFIRMLKDDG